MLLQNLNVDLASCFNMRALVGFCFYFDVSYLMHVLSFTANAFHFRYVFSVLNLCFSRLDNLMGSRERIFMGDYFL